MRVLYICKGNAGRSQIAQAFFNKIYEPEHEAFSAGTEVGEKEGEYLSEDVKKCMAEKGISLEWNYRKGLQRNIFMVERADLIISFLPGEELPDYVRGHPEIVFWEVEDTKGMEYSELCKARDKIIGLVEDLDIELDF